MRKAENVKICPACGAATKVYDTRLMRGRLYRYRECTACRARYKTVELFYELTDSDGMIIPQETEVKK